MNRKTFLKLDTTIRPIYAHSIDEFNSYVDKYKAPNEIILTKSNNISQANLRNMPCCRTWKRGNRYEFQYIDANIQIRVLYAIHYDEGSDTDERLAYDALNYFKGCMDVIPTDDVEEDIEMFTCPENPVSAYYNYVDNRALDITVDHCYSLDRNNSFPASMMEEYPQTRPWVEKYYAERLASKKTMTKEEYARFKVFGSIFVGWLNNPRYHRSHAWKKIVSNSNRKVHQLRRFIEESGHRVLLVNTDAVKFVGHVDYEGSTELGGFKYEWEDTKMYIRGVKSYAYFDTNMNKWRFKQAGKTTLDIVKPDRETWTLDEFRYGFDGEIAHIRKARNSNYLLEVFE